MYKEAIEAYKQAIRTNPDDADAHYNLGLTYAFLNDGDSALEHYEILKSLDSERANELYNMIYK
jgi:tetratricopeptide (TPR) repeat protein